MTTVSDDRQGREGGAVPPATAGGAGGQVLLATGRATASPRRPARGALRRGESALGWMFVSPALVVLLLFLVIPIILALYVSFTDWSGVTPPLSSKVHLVGLANYRALLTASGGLTRQLFGTSVRNNFYFVIFTVPLQTALAMFLAVLVNNKFLRGRGFFRTAFYFPSVTSSIAIAMIFLFLFQGSGIVNDILSWFGLKGPDWINDQNGVFWDVLSWFGVSSSPGWAADHGFLGISWWQWFAGPSLGMCVIIILLVWTTAGTFMLFFLGGLAQISEDLDEASEVDGATKWQRFRHVTLPMMRPMLVLVVTLGFISTWQVFDQVYIFYQSAVAGNPTTTTPAYFSYQESFNNFAFGVGAAVAFLLFVFIVSMTALQRRLVKEDLTQ